MNGSAPPGVSTSRPERVVRIIVQSVAAVLVLVEIGVLLTGVLARFVFHHPLVWTDELASMLFLWLAMTGSIIALDRNEHMGLSTIVMRFSPTAQAQASSFAAGATLVFLLSILQSAYEYALDEWYIETPALGLHNTFRAAAIPVGVTLMALVALLRIWRLGRQRLLVTAAGLGLLAVVIRLAAPALHASGSWSLLVFFVLLLGLAVALAMPIGFAFGVATVTYLLTMTFTPLSLVVSRMDEGMSGLILLSVPLFIFLGLLIEMTGMARAMIGCLAALLGHVRGGLCYVLLGAMYLVSGISGSKAADMAAVAPALLPEMKLRGIPEGELISLLAASGAMSETIPPSLVLITIGSVTGVSIAALFTGGLLPALILAIVLALLARWRARHEDINHILRKPLWEVGRLFVYATPSLALPFLIRTAVVEGVATATEVSTIGIVYCLVAGLVLYRQFDWSRIYPMLIETACLSGAILLIIGTATGMGWALTQSGFSRLLVESVSAVPGGAWTFMLGSIVVFVVLGSVLEGIPAIVLFGPLMFPGARLVGIHEVHYAIVVILAMGIGLFAPPFGVGYYAACAVGRVTPDVAMGHIWPYLLALLVGLLIVAAVPWLSIGFLS